MKTIITALAAATTVAWLAASLPAAAQAQQPRDEIFIYATYFHCNKAIYYRADDSVARLYGPELNDLVKEGLVSSWGWLGKDTGGEWERAGYFIGKKLKDVLDASAQLKVRSDWRLQVREFAEACGSSEDYIWHVLAGNLGGAHLGKVAFSTYYACDEGRETQLDAELKRDFAPTYDKLVAAGTLTSWGWAEQIVGGMYRRLSTMSAPTVESLMAARKELALNKAVSAICRSHQDYIWDVKDQGS
jgi:hypothetical protein